MVALSSKSPPKLLPPPPPARPNQSIEKSCAVLDFINNVLCRSLYPGNATKGGSVHPGTDPSGRICYSQSERSFSGRAPIQGLVWSLVREQEGSRDEFVVLGMLILF